MLMNKNNTRDRTNRVYFFSEMVLVKQMDKTKKAMHAVDKQALGTSKRSGHHKFFVVANSDL
jgi:hypothetical protein